MRSVEPDPNDEYFDIVDRDGTPTGEVKSRFAVHRDGDWHRAFHCWVVLRLDSGEPAVLFQRRSLIKDTHPDKLDVAVGGHYRAGEGFDDVLREMEEELGIAPPADHLRRIGLRRAVGRQPGVIDREIEELYVHCLAVPIEMLRPAYEEITALDIVTMHDLEDLYSGRRPEVDSIRYQVRPDNTLSARAVTPVAMDDFIAVSDEYFIKGSRAAVQVLEGNPDVSLHLG